MNREKTDKIYNSITSNGCREMDEERLHQAVNDCIADVRNKLGHVTHLISLVERRNDPKNKDYIELRLDEACKKSRESIEYIKNL